MKKIEDRLRKPVNRREVTPEWITGQLKKLLPHGACAEKLIQFAPDLVDVLSPKSDLGLSDKQRAREVENVIRSAIKKMAVNYEENVEEALCRNLALREGMGLHGRILDNDRTLTKKCRRLAAEVLGIKPDTYRKFYEPRYLEGLTRVLYDEVKK